MADWHHLTHKVSGDTQVVASLGGIDLSEWEALPLAREPKEDEDVQPDGKIKKNTDKRKKLNHAGKWGSMSRAQMGEQIDALEERIAALEAIVKSK